MKDKIKCPKCGHEQEVRSKLIYITCSSCQRKIKNTTIGGKK